MGKFAKNTTTTFVTRVMGFIVGMGTSILIARLLGPEGKGIYKLAVLLPSLIVTFTNLGIGPATVYHMGKEKHDRETIFGNNLVLGAAISAVALLVGLILIVFFQDLLFEGVPLYLLLIALPIIPLQLFYQYFKNLFLGLGDFKKFNLYKIMQKASLLVILAIVLGGLKEGVIGALLASIMATFITLAVGICWSYNAIGEPEHNLSPSYVKDVTTYGIKAHMGNIIGFLNYRFDMFLVSAFLNPTAVGFYSIAVGVAEKIWLVSRSAGTVLFPRVSSETDEDRRKKFTPIVSRNVLFISLIGALILFFVSRWLVLLLYSKAFLASIRPLQVLLPGVVAMSVDRVLSNDLAGRGRPLLNTYMGVVTVITNIGLNVLWIPRYGILGAALASAVAYSVEMVGKLIIYYYLSGNSPFVTLVPRWSDFQLYKDYGLLIYRKVRGEKP